MLPDSPLLSGTSTSNMFAGFQHTYGLPIMEDGPYTSTSDTAPPASSSQHTTEQSTPMLNGSSRAPVSSVTSFCLSSHIHRSVYSNIHPACHLFILVRPPLTPETPCVSAFGEDNIISAHSAIRVFRHISFSPFAPWVKATCPHTRVIVIPPPLIGFQRPL